MVPINWYIVLSAVLFGLGTLAFFSTRVSYEPMFTGLAAADAAKVVAELEKDKVPYRMGAGGTAIEVPADKVDRYRMKLAPNISSGDVAGWDELVNQNSAMSSDLIQRANLRRVKDGVLARAIMTMDEIEKAIVQVVEPRNTMRCDRIVQPGGCVDVCSRIWRAAIAPSS